MTKINLQNKIAEPVLKSTENVYMRRTDTYIFTYKGHDIEVDKTIINDSISGDYDMDYEIMNETALPDHWTDDEWDLIDDFISDEIMK